MGQGALSKPSVQWWLSLNSSKLWVGCLSTLHRAIHYGRRVFWC